MPRCILDIDIGILSNDKQDDDDDNDEDDDDDDDTDDEQNNFNEVANKNHKEKIEKEETVNQVLDNLTSIFQNNHLEPIPGRKHPRSAGCIRLITSLFRIVTRFLILIVGTHRGRT